MFFLDINNPQRIWIHLHGFGTDITGSKIEFARNYFRRTKLYSFFAMDMDYEKHTTTEVLDVLEALVLGFSDRFGEITLCGSSHGGYVVANYLRFRKLGNVKKTLLLAPSFETLGLIVRELGEDKVKRWLEGREPLRFEEEGREIEVREDFAKDIREKGYEILEGDRVNFPQDPPVSLVVVHGRRDEIIPVERTRTFVSKVRVSRYVEVDDDHQLSETFGRILLQLIEEGAV
jgi:pimeloyl-ACP methyl ester carboxylesterase